MDGRIQCGPMLCEHDYYCDEWIKVCVRCSVPCTDPNDVNICRIKCPVFYNRLNSTSSPQITVTSPRVPLGSSNQSSLIIGTSIVVPILVILVILVALCSVRRRGKRKGNKSRTDLKCSTDEQEGTELNSTDDGGPPKYGHQESRDSEASGSHTPPHWTSGRKHEHLSLVCAEDPSHPEPSSFLLNGHSYPNLHSGLQLLPDTRGALSTMNSGLENRLESMLWPSGFHSSFEASKDENFSVPQDSERSPQSSSPRTLIGQDVPDTPSSDQLILLDAVIDERRDSGSSTPHIPVRRIQCQASEFSAAASLNLIEDTIPGPDQDRILSASPPTEGRDHTNKWNLILKMYDAVDTRMHELPFVAGCMIGGEALQVYVRVSPDHDLQSCYNHIHNILPREDGVEALLVVQPE